MALRRSFGVLFLLLAALAAGAEESPWQRQLQGADARKAADLEKRVNELEAAGKFAEAVQPAEELLALRQRRQGEDHWQAADARRLVEKLKKAANLPAEQQRRLAEVPGLRARAQNLYHRGKYAEAESLHRKALAVREEALGPRHPDTATSYSNLAYNLDLQGRHAEAEPLHRKALAIREEALGPRHPSTAGTYDNLAINLDQQGRHAEAEPLCRQALAIFEQALGPRHTDTATCYDSLANILYFQGKYAEAEPLYRKALAIWEEALGPRHPDTTYGYNNLAIILDRQGKYAEAEPLCRQALAIYEQALGPRHPDTARSYNNLAHSLDGQGKHAEAEQSYRKALAIWEEALGPRHPDTTTGYEDLANNLGQQGKYAEAEPLYRKALAAFEVARLRAAATGFGRAAARITPHLGLAVCLAQLVEPAEAWEAAEAGLARGLLDDLAARTPLADNPERERRLRQRAVRLEELDRLLVPLLAAEALSETDRQRRDELSRERAGLQEEMDREAAEQARGRVLPLERIQRQLPADAALVVWIDNPTLTGSAEPGSWHWGCVVRHSGPPAWVQLPGSGPDKGWTREDDELPGRFRRALARRSPGWEDLAGRLRAQRLDPLEPLLAATADRPAARRLVAVPVTSMAGVPLEALGGGYAVSYAPSGTVFARLAEDHRPLRDPSLLALGDPAFARRDDPPAPPLPEHGLLVVQVLPGSNAETAGLRSDDVLLRYGDTELTALADLKLKEDGDPVPLRGWRDGRTRELTVAPGKLGVTFHREPAPAALKQRRELQHLLASTRGPEPKPLPGTRREVQALASLFRKDRTQLLLGPDASEQRLDELADGHRLKDFRVLHFATHGAIDPAVPLRSGLLLADDRLPDAEARARAGQKVYTGRLTAGALAGWDLDADLVVLSACDTGLGKDAGGEGFLGFSQVLFRAGARSLVLSLWEVDDAATALLMTRFYENLLGKREGLKGPMGRAEALREAKAWLRDLSRPEAEALAASCAGR
jgi:tetratricopeptide (TPR) repeat protein